MVFALVDELAGANLRAVGFEAYPKLKLTYYAACLACALCVWLLPRWAAPVTLAESSVNLLRP